MQTELTMVCSAREGTNITKPTYSPPDDLAHRHTDRHIGTQTDTHRQTHTHTHRQTHTHIHTGRHRPTN